MVIPCCPPFPFPLVSLVHGICFVLPPCPAAGRELGELEGTYKVILIPSSLRASPQRNLVEHHLRPGVSLLES